MNRPQLVRQNAAIAANAEDADIWRWFAMLVDERRVRWCNANGSWLVSIDHRHVATEDSFDRAIRAARLEHLRHGQQKMRGAQSARRLTSSPALSAATR